ncbi:MAG: hypothetical protein R3B70_39230 [Polyangiaceae bacterium]
MNRPSLLPALVILVAASLTALVPGCGKNGEGERCDRENNDVDCEPPLVCTPAYLIGRPSDLCCPSDLSSATDARCKPNTATVGEGGGGTGGTGTTTASTGGTGGTGGSTAGSGGTGGSTAGSGGTGGSAAGSGGTGGM